jgi:hypothetical protein
VVKGGSVGVTLNGNDSSFFRTGKGLRQGDPLSPMLYNLVGDVLTKMLVKAASNNLIKGLPPSTGSEVSRCNMQMIPSSSLIQTTPT